MFSSDAPVEICILKFYPNHSTLRRIGSISAAVETNPRKSVCTLVHRNNTPRRAMQRVVHQALGLPSRVGIFKSRLTPNVRKKTF